MRTCYLHIGPPKSGTSSIQHALKDRQRFQSRYGLYVPMCGRIGNGSHYALAHALAGMPVAPEHSDCVASFEREIARERHLPIVISSEFFWPILSTPSRAAAVIDRMKGLGFDVVLLMYARNQPQLINSSYAQGVKLFRHDLSFRDYARKAMKATGRFSFGHWLEIADTLGVRLIARPMNGETRRAGLIADFLRTLGASDEGDSAIADPKLNQSIGPFAVDVGREVLRHVGGPRRLTVKQMGRCGRALRDEVRELDLSDDGYCGLTSELAKEIEAYFQADNDRFAANLWGTTWQETFAGDTNQLHDCNDYEVVGVPPERREQRAGVIQRLQKLVDRSIAEPVAAGSVRLSAVFKWPRRAVRSIRRRMNGAFSRPSSAAR